MAINTQLKRIKQNHRKLKKNHNQLRLKYKFNKKKRFEIINKVGDKLGITPNFSNAQRVKRGLPHILRHISVTRK